MDNTESDSNISFEDENEFYFESDHLALKDNKDYRQLLKTLLTLEVQRSQAIEELEKVRNEMKSCLKNPIELVEKLSKGEILDLPPDIQLQELPDIDWSKYEGVMPKEINTPITRNKKINIYQKHSLSEFDDKILIRGKCFDDSKPETFNQLWTPEEQKRLEELLVEFPEEEVEVKRWRKIATALGNRTPAQVQSRIQKYFKKLRLAGMPIPGRNPRNVTDIKGKSKSNTTNMFLKQSTFFPSFFTPVRMSENTSADCYPSSSSFTGTDHQLIINGENKAEALKCIISEKESSGGLHEGYACDGCREQPIQGTRWNCEGCSKFENSFDLCCDCIAALILEDKKLVSTPLHHNITHKFRGVRKENYSYDPDYLAPSTSYNYLDSNFMPE